MTENKPIIDGVDVSGCEKQGETINGITCGNGTKIRLADRYIYKYKLCKDNPNCLFKQLVRKTQECVKLRTDIKDIADLLDLDTGEEYNFGNIEISIKGLKQECEIKTLEIEGIKKQLEQLKVKNEKLKDEIEACYNQVEDFDIIATSKSNKLKQAEQKLEKIKDRCNETLEIMNKASGTNAYAGGRCTEAGQILQIIDEGE